MLSTCTASEKHIFRRNNFAKERLPLSFLLSFFSTFYPRERKIPPKRLFPRSKRTKQRNIYLLSANIQYSSIVCQCNNIIKSVRRSKKQADPIPARSTVCSRVCFAATFSTDPSYIACIYMYIHIYARCPSVSRFGRK